MEQAATQHESTLRELRWETYDDQGQEDGMGVRWGLRPRPPGISTITPSESWALTALEAPLFVYMVAGSAGKAVRQHGMALGGPGDMH